MGDKRISAEENQTLREIDNDEIKERKSKDFEIFGIQKLSEKGSRRVSRRSSKDASRKSKCKIELDLLAMGSDTTENYDSEFINETDNFENFKDNFKRRKIEVQGDDFSSEDEDSAVKYLETDFKSSSNQISNEYFEEKFIKKNFEYHQNFESFEDFSDNKQNGLIEDIYGLNINFNKREVIESKEVRKSYETLEVKEVIKQSQKKSKIIKENQNIFNILKEAEPKKNKEKNIDFYLNFEKEEFDTNPSSKKTRRVTEMESTGKKQIETKRKRGHGNCKISSWRKKKEDRRLSGTSGSRGGGGGSWGFNLNG